MRVTQVHRASLSGLCALAALFATASCGDDSGTDDTAPDAQADIDAQNPDVDASPAELPPGGYMALVIYDSSRYGYAALWSDVVLVEGAPEPIPPILPATEDSIVVVDDQEPPPELPQNIFTLLDAGPTLFSFFAEEMFAYHRDPEYGTYAMDLTEGEIPIVPGPASFLIPAVGETPEARYDEVFAIAPFANRTPGVDSIPNPAVPIDVTWSGAPADTAVGLDVLSLDADGNFHFDCFADVVNDGAFTVPAACIDPTAMVVIIGMNTTIQREVEYEGRRVQLSGRYQTQVNLTPPDPSPAQAAANAALSTCLAFARQRTGHGPDRRRAFLSAASQCVAK